MTEVATQSSASQAATSSPRGPVGADPRDYLPAAHRAPDEGRFDAVQHTTVDPEPARPVAEVTADLAARGVEPDASYVPASMRPVEPVDAEPEPVAEAPKPVDPKDLPTEVTCAEGDTHVTVSWRGLTWKFPKRRGAWDMNVQFAFEEGMRNRGLFILLAGTADGDAADMARARLYTVSKTADDFDDFQSVITAAILEHCE